MSNNYLKSQNKITARRWYTDVDLNLNPHPASGDLVLKPSNDSVTMKKIQTLILET